MKRFRSVVFWMHLTAGVTAGVIVFVMSITGALLALKPQILNGVEANARLVTPPRGGPRLGVQALVASVRTARPDVRPTTVTLQADRTASASVALGRDGTIYVDPYSGRVLGEGSRRAQLFFRTVEDWHRFLFSRRHGSVSVVTAHMVLVDTATATVSKWEPYDGTRRGQKWRG
jgi:uncharacterized iron-regulated membrane protein